MKNTTYINAGAGSGKTYTLTTMLAEKLSKGNLQPAEVILTTFTDLAATEFREKARQELLTKGNLDAAAQIDSMAIGTVHSVAYRFIKRFWYLLEYGADIQVISEANEDFYMSQSLSRIAKDEHYKGDIATFKKFREHYNFTNWFGQPDDLFWQQILSDVVEKMEYYEVDDVSESISRSIETVKSIYVGPQFNETVHDQLLSYLRKYYQYISLSSTDAATKQSKLIKSLLNGFKSIYELSPILSEMGKSPVGGSSKIETNCPGYLGFMSVALSLFDSTSELEFLEPFIKSIFNLAKVWRDDYVDYKKRNHIMSYNDLEKIFLQLITEEPEVQEYIRSNYKLLMVDEFQDSNPIQLKIFNQLSELLADVNGHSYWVGDPKQAIYGFRGADTELVNSVSKYFHFYNDAMIHAEEGENRLGSGRLTESWRSRSELVDLVNETFLEPFKMDGINDLLITLAPHYKQDNIDAPSICHLKSSAKNADDAANELAYYVSNMLHKDIVVHHGKQDEMPTPIMPKDIAILCRKNEQCSKIINALRRYNVPVSEPEDNLMQRLEVQLTLSILRYIQNPYSKATIAGLKRLMFNESVSDILRGRIEYIQGLKSKDCQQSADCWQEDSVELNKLAELVSHFKNLSISEIVKSIIYRCDIISLCAKWGDYNTRMQNLLTLQSLADDYDQVCLQMGLGSSISGFIYYLNSVEPQKIKDNMSDTVKVFTYHSAKGLEWPMVIMYDLDANVLNDASFVKKQFMKVREIVDESDNSSVDNPFAKKYYLHYVPCVACGNSNVAQTVSDKIISLPLYQELKRRACSEERRLLYVGMTRAKDYLYTFSRGNNFTFTWLQNAGVNNPTIVSPWGNDNHIPLAEELSLPIDSCEEVQESYDTLDKPESHIMREPRYISPSKLESFANAYSSHRQWTEHGEKIDTTGWGSEYAKIGTCIHDIFAVYRHDNHALSEKLAKQVIYGYGLTDRLTSKVQAILESAKWLYDLLMSKFPQSESDNTHCELPFMSTLENGQVLRGEIDLLWEYTDKNGVKQCVLVDYKTFPGVALNEHTTKYYAQLSAYAKALKAEGYTLSNALVYYPVHGIIYELLKDNSDN